MLGGEQHVTKGDVVKFCRGTDNGIDYAVPQPWLDKVRGLGIYTTFVWSYVSEDDNKPMYGHPVAIGDMILDELHSGNAVLLKTEEYESLVTQLDIARKILKIHRGEKIE